MSICRRCGKPIKWDTDANGKLIAVERMTYFVPDPDGDMLFLNLKGIVMRGIERKDGIPGSVIHSQNCKLKIERVFLGTNKPATSAKSRKLLYNQLHPKAKPVKKEDPRAGQMSLF